MRPSFSDLEYSAKKTLTRRDRFLAGIHAATLRAALEVEIEPFYPKGEGRGRPPIGLSRMLRMYVAQQSFGLSDKGMDDALYDSQAIRGFVGIDLSRESAPDATTLLKFRRLLETRGLMRKIRYRVLAKNEVQLFSLFGFANLVLANRRMPATHSRGAREGIRGQMSSKIEFDD